MSDDIIAITTKRAFVHATSVPADREIAKSLCPICNCGVAELCVECESKGDQGDCLIIRGGCGHLFHDHCMIGWLIKNASCPVCQQTWIADGPPRSV